MNSWTTEVYADERTGKAPLAAWVTGLSDPKFAALDAAIKHVLEVRGLELAGSAWLKPLGGGLHEFRVRHDAATIGRMFAREAFAHATDESILLRVFCHFYGDRVILLMSGYDKGRDTSEKRQQTEIQTARTLLTAWQEAEKRTRAKRRQS